ncbi:hypothetical protein, partial [Pelagicoccus sp. SDUM812003]|uniref:hypothetical protein n=1 Tax=Pelagicoccus sp. SDUM812003 TaxID=3041267 RepID=UPI00280DA3B3
MKNITKSIFALLASAAISSGALAISTQNAYVWDEVGTLASQTGETDGDASVFVAPLGDWNVSFSSGFILPSTGGGAPFLHSSLAGNNTTGGINELTGLF